MDSQKTAWILDNGGAVSKDAANHTWKWEVASDRQVTNVYSLFFCRVCLGNPYLIEGDLLNASSMHDFCWCQDPTEKLESLAEEWNLSRGHDSFYVKGRKGRQRINLGVSNSEYVVFHPYQVLPLYRIDYEIH